MSLGRRKVSIGDPAGWVFNRMADVYEARPAYPAAVLDVLSELAGPGGTSIADVGAGIGHLALPLAERGHDVLAIEPAGAMLAALEERAHLRGLSLRTHHGVAEALPLADTSVDMVLIADAIHFLDKELTALEVARVLKPRGALAVVTSEFADTPFMRAVREVMEAAAPRRPRSVGAAVTQLARVARVRLAPAHRVVDETPMDFERIERILRSISFIGPAMNSARSEAFMARIAALPGPRIWSRLLTVHAGRRGPPSRRLAPPRRVDDDSDALRP